MANLRVQRRRSLRTEQGASLVEFALLAPLLFMILFGTLTGGLTLSRHNSVKNAVREAARYGAVAPVTAATVDSYLGKVLAQARDAATGDLSETVPDQYICVAVVYETDSTPAHANRQLVQDTGGPPAASDGLCFSDGRPADETRVQVLARRTSEISAILYSDDVPLSSRSVTRYER